MKYEIRMDYNLLSKIKFFSNKNSLVEVGAYPIGTIAMDERLNKWTVIVQDFFLCESLGTASFYCFNTNDQQKAISYINKNFVTNNEKNFRIIGTFHSHAQNDAFISSTDAKEFSNRNGAEVYFIYSPRTEKFLSYFRTPDKKLHEVIPIITNNNDEQLIYHQKCKSIIKLSKSEDRIYSPTNTPAFIQSFSKIIQYDKEVSNQLNDRFNYNYELLRNKKILLVGGGSLGNPIAEILCLSGIHNLDIVDCDRYVLENLPRSNLIKFKDALNKEPKSFCLGKRIVELARFNINIKAFYADITSLGFGFVKQYDIVICVPDSLSVRKFVSTACTLFNVPFIEAANKLVHNNIIGKISFQPSSKTTCYTCCNHYDDVIEQVKKASCSSIDNKAQPQVPTMSANLASNLSSIVIDFLLDRIKPEYFMELNFVRYEIKKRIFTAINQNCNVHAHLKEKISSISISSTKDLYDGLKKIFKTKNPFEINVLNSRLSYLYTRKENPFTSIRLDKRTNIDNLLNELPKHHVYEIIDKGSGQTKWIEINIKNL